MMRIALVRSFENFYQKRFHLRGEEAVDAECSAEKVIRDHSKRQKLHVENLEFALGSSS